MSELTYPEVGATGHDVLPVGYHHLRESLVLGTGDEVFAAAVEALMTWRMHERAGVRKVSGPGRAALGADVRFGFLGQPIPCRVVEVVVEPDRRGFAYGTLPGHPEIGEERFLIERNGVSGQVMARVTAFSRPGTWRTRVIGPIGRLVQKLMARRYLKALRSFVS